MDIKRFALVLCTALFLSSCAPAASSSVVPSSDPSSSVSSSSSSSSVSSESSSSTSEAPHYDPANYYGGYYSSLVSWTDGEDLKSQLHAIISGGDYQPITYAGTYTNWFSNQNADRSFTDREQLDVIYSDDPIMATATNTGWQREHAWPASLMTGSTTENAVKFLGRATDFHNLFAAYANANSSRGNKNYGNADETDASYTNRIGSGGGYAFDSKTFEPGDPDKGRTARAIFYMATMYCEEVLDTANNVTMKPLTIVEEHVDYVAGNNCAFAIGHKSELLEWAKKPVDLLECQHNESVYSFVAPTHSHEENNVAQGNRNPYVDYPELVEYVFGEKSDQPGRLEDLTPTYETLGMGEKSTYSFAIEKAKRSYKVGEAIAKDDVSVIAINNDLSERTITDFTISPAEGSCFATEGAHSITVQIGGYSMSYSVEAKIGFDWMYEFEKQTFAEIRTIAAADHHLTLSGMAWTVRWDQGYISTSLSRDGLKFGQNNTDSSSWVKRLTFESDASFEINGRKSIDVIAIKGAPASGQSLQIKYYVDGVLQGIKALSYSRTEIYEARLSLSIPKEGKILIEILNDAKPFSLNHIAVIAH